MCSSISNNSAQTTHKHIHSVAKPLKFDWAFIWQIKTYFFCSTFSCILLFYCWFSFKYVLHSWFSFIMKWVSSRSSLVHNFIYFYLFYFVSLIAQNGDLVNKSQIREKIFVRQYVSDIVLTLIPLKCGCMYVSQSVNSSKSWAKTAAHNIWASLHTNILSSFFISCVISQHFLHTINWINWISTHYNM